MPAEWGVVLAALLIAAALGVVCWIWRRRRSR